MTPSPPSVRPHSAPAGTGASGLPPPPSVPDNHGGAGVLIGGGWRAGQKPGGQRRGQHGQHAQQQHARGNGSVGGRGGGPGVNEAGMPLERGYQVKSTAQVRREGMDGTGL